MANNRLIIKGEKELFKALSDFGKDARTGVAATTERIAEQMAKDAAANVATDNGKIKQQIRAEKITDLKWRVGANASYSAYVEFGTGTFVQVAPEWKDLAWEFYVNGKGMMRPQPFLYPAFKTAKVNYEDTLKQLLEHLTNKANK